MRASEKPREHRVWECDHMRLVVRDDAGRWRHIATTGSLGSDCLAGVYFIDMEVTGAHTFAVHHTRAIR